MSEKRIVATRHTIISGGPGEPSHSLAPGESVTFDEDNEAHKAIVAEIESGRDTGLEVQEGEGGGQGASTALEGEHPDDVLQAPARALEQEVREAPFANAQDEAQPDEAKEGAEELQEAVEAEQERQAEEADDEGSSSPPTTRARRKG